jgi:hypothetical protein
MNVCLQFVSPLALLFVLHSARGVETVPVPNDDWMRATVEVRLLEEGVRLAGLPIPIEVIVRNDTGGALLLPVPTAAAYGVQHTVDVLWSNDGADSSFAVVRQVEAYFGPLVLADPRPPALRPLAAGESRVLRLALSYDWSGWFRPEGPRLIMRPGRAQIKARLNAIVPDEQWGLRVDHNHGVLSNTIDVEIATPEGETAAAYEKLLQAPRPWLICAPHKVRADMPPVRDLEVLEDLIRTYPDTPYATHARAVVAAFYTGPYMPAGAGDLSSRRAKARELLQAALADPRYILRDEAKRMLDGLAVATSQPAEPIPEAPKGPPPEVQPLTAQDRQTIEARLQAFATAMSKGDFDGLARLLTDDFRYNRASDKPRFLQICRDDWERELPRKTGGRLDLLRVELVVNDVQASESGAVAKGLARAMVDTTAISPWTPWDFRLARAGDDWRISEFSRHAPTRGAR